MISGLFNASFRPSGRYTGAVGFEPTTCGFGVLNIAFYDFSQDFVASRKAL